MVQLLGVTDGLVFKDITETILHYYDEIMAQADALDDARWELDELLAEREKINAQLQEILDTHTDPWGIKVATVELKHIDLPGEMQRAIARQAEAERERRAKVINAEGEFQAASKLAEASEIIEKHPTALQLRYLQTMNEMSTESNSTMIFPIPIELFKPFARLFEKGDKE